MTAELDRAQTVFGIMADGMKRVLEQFPFELGIHSVAAAIALTNFTGFICPGDQRAFPQMNSVDRLNQ
ncbi:hypothetical protein D3C73_1479820 [compost metagenome]